MRWICCATERPVFFRYDRTSHTGYVSTGDEPVGEGENEPNDSESQPPVPRKPPLPPKKDKKGKRSSKTPPADKPKP